MSTSSQDSRPHQDHRYDPYYSYYYHRRPYSYDYPRHFYAAAASPSSLVLPSYSSHHHTGSYGGGTVACCPVAKSGGNDSGDQTAMLLNLLSVGIALFALAQALMSNNNTNTGKRKRRRKREELRSGQDKYSTTSVSNSMSEMVLSWVFL